MRKNDRIRLQHMLDAAREAVSFVRGKKREDLDRDRLLVFGLVKALEILGTPPTGFLRRLGLNFPLSRGRMLLA